MAAKKTVAQQHKQADKPPAKTAKSTTVKTAAKKSTTKVDRATHATSGTVTSRAVKARSAAQSAVAGQMDLFAVAGLVRAQRRRQVKKQLRVLRGDRGEQR